MEVSTLQVSGEGHTGVSGTVSIKDLQNKDLSVLQSHHKGQYKQSLSS